MALNQTTGITAWVYRRLYLCLLNALLRTSITVTLHTVRFAVDSGGAGVINSYTVPTTDAGSQLGCTLSQVLVSRSPFQPHIEYGSCCRIDCTGWASRRGLTRGRRLHGSAGVHQRRGEHQPHFLLTRRYRDGAFDAGRLASPPSQRLPPTWWPGCCLMAPWTRPSPRRCRLSKLPDLIVPIPQWETPSPSLM